MAPLERAGGSTFPRRKKALFLALGCSFIVIIGQYIFGMSFATEQNWADLEKTSRLHEPILESPPPAPETPPPAPESPPQPIEVRSEVRFVPEKEPSLSEVAPPPPPPKPVVPRPPPVREATKDCVLNSASPPLIVFGIFIPPINSWKSNLISYLAKCREMFSNNCTGCQWAVDFHAVISSESSTEGVDEAAQIVNEYNGNAKIIRAKLGRFYEFPALFHVWNESRTGDPERLIAYFHTKGNTRGMHCEGFLDLFDLNETCKVFRDYQNISKLVFESSSPSGWGWYNFWWAKAGFLRNQHAPVVSKDRWSFEDWLGTKWTGVDAERYPPKLYSWCHKEVEPAYTPPGRCHVPCVFVSQSEEDKLELDALHRVIDCKKKQQIVDPDTSRKQVLVSIVHFINDESQRIASEANLAFFLHHGLGPTPVPEIQFSLVTDYTPVYIPARVDLFVSVLDVHQGGPRDVWSMHRESLRSAGVTGSETTGYSSFIFLSTASLRGPFRSPPGHHWTMPLTARLSGNVGFVSCCFDPWSRQENELIAMNRAVVHAMLRHGLFNVSTGVTAMAPVFQSLGMEVEMMTFSAVGFEPKDKPEIELLTSRAKEEREGKYWAELQQSVQGCDHLVGVPATCAARWAQCRLPIADEHTLGDVQLARELPGELAVLNGERQRLCIEAKQERFLTFHSGGAVTSQRESIRHAVLLAIALDRTLVLPNVHTRKVLPDRIVWDDRPFTTWFSFSHFEETMRDMVRVVMHLPEGIHDDHAIEVPQSSRTYEEVVEDVRNASCCQGAGLQRVVNLLNVRRCCESRPNRTSIPQFVAALQGLAKAFKPSCELEQRVYQVLQKLGGRGSYVAVHEPTEWDWEYRHCQLGKESYGEICASSQMRAYQLQQGGYIGQSDMVYVAGSDISEVSLEYYRKVAGNVTSMSLMGFSWFDKLDADTKALIDFEVCRLAKRMFGNSHSSFDRELWLQKTTVQAMGDGGTLHYPTTDWFVDMSTFKCDADCQSMGLSNFILFPGCHKSLPDMRNLLVGAIYLAYHTGVRVVFPGAGVKFLNGGGFDILVSALSGLDRPVKFYSELPKRYRRVDLLSTPVPQELSASSRNLEEFLLAARASDTLRWQRLLPWPCHAKLLPRELGSVEDKYRPDIEHIVAQATPSCLCSTTTLRHINGARRCSEEREVCGCVGLVKMCVPGNDELCSEPRRVTNGSVYCDTEFFGDPLFGTRKACWCYPATPCESLPCECNGVLAIESPGQWHYCESGMDDCDLPSLCVSD